MQGSTSASRKDAYMSDGGSIITPFGLQATDHSDNYLVEWRGDEQLSDIRQVSSFYANMAVAVSFVCQGSFARFLPALHD